MPPLARFYLLRSNKRKLQLSIAYKLTADPSASGATKGNYNFLGHRNALLVVPLAGATKGNYNLQHRRGGHRFLSGSNKRKLQREAFYRTYLMPARKREQQKETTTLGRRGASTFTSLSTEQQKETTTLRLSAQPRGSQWSNKRKLQPTFSAGDPARRQAGSNKRKLQLSRKRCHGFSLSRGEQQKETTTSNISVTYSTLAYMSSAGATKGNYNPFLRRVQRKPTADLGATKGNYNVQHARD